MPLSKGIFLSNSPPTQPFANRRRHWQVIGLWVGLLFWVACAQEADSYRPPVALPAVSGYTLLAFLSPSCGHCRVMQPVVQQVAASCKELFAVQEINIQEERHQHLLQRFRIMGVPTLVYVDDQGKELVRLTGRHSEQEITNTLQPYLQQPCSIASHPVHG